MLVTVLVTSTKLSYTSSPVSTGIGDVHLSVFIEVTQPGHPSVRRCSEYRWWFWPPLGKNGEFCIAVGRATSTGVILAMGVGC